ncbi:MAG TPA: glycosyltransferase [bacterium]|nr:glycosyltransferase [bacterium]
MKILIIHDRFMFRGGAERLVLIMAKALQADLMTEFWIDGETFERAEAPGKIFVLDKGNPAYEVLRYFRAQFNFLFKTRKIVRQYDVVIFSGNNCLIANWHLKRKQKRFIYCHSPVRHVFDLYKKFRAERPELWKKIIYYDIGAWGIRLVYWFNLIFFKKVIANSKNTQARLWKYCCKKSEIIWPPIQVNKFKWFSSGDYYLSFARVDKLKRVGDIVRAFQKMPNKKLVICSAGDDFENVKNLAKGFNNIQVKGWQNDEELSLLVGNCVATLYIPIDEDFGMTPLEGMSAGKPCVGVFEGGLKETIIDEKTGKFIPADYTVDDIIKAVEWLSPARALTMLADCEAQADKFSEDKFINEIKKVINEL